MSRRIFGMGLALAVVCPPVSVAHPDQKLSVGLVSPLTKVLIEPGPDDETPGRVRLPPLQRAYPLTAARNEYESLQLVLVNGDEPLEGVTVSCSDADASQGGRSSPLPTELFWEHYVFVYKPSGNALDEPMWYPDALIPLTVQPARRMEARQTRVIWITVHVPPEARPDTYHKRLRILSGKGVPLAAMTFTVNVADFTVPETRHFNATGALYYEIVRDYYNKHFRTGATRFEQDSPEWAELRRIYYEYLLKYRFTPYDLPVPPDSAEAEKYLKDPRVNCFRLPWIGSEDRGFGSMVRQLKESGALARAYYYQADEPTVAAYPEVLQLATRLRRADRRLRHLVTLPPVLPLCGLVDIWCPNIGDALNLGRMDLDRLNLRRRLGEETWWYTMTVPRYPYPTWLVDEDCVAPRLFFWMASLYGFNGCVYSMVHGWSEDPYRKVESFMDSNGDGLLIYPGEPFGSREPFPSIRLMLLRDGLEDYEMLRLLPPGLKERACRALIQDLTRFSRSPERLELVRQKIMQVLAHRKAAFDLAPHHQSEWPSGSIVCEIPGTSTPPTIDGVLRKGEWGHARSLSDFRKANGLKRAGAATVATLCYDSANLYVAAEGDLPAATAKDPLARQWFGFCIDPGRKRNRYYVFIVTAKGNSHTELRSSEGMDPDWRKPWTYKSLVSNGRVVVEMAIPFASLGHTPKPGEVWGFNVRRRSREELSGWQADFSDVSLLPGLKFGPSATR